MVDCSLIAIEEISNDQRLLILNYLISNKGVKPPRDLNVTPNYISMIRNGKRRVSDELLCTMLRFLTPEELQALLKGWVPEKRATLSDALRVIITAREDPPEFREQFLALLSRYLGDYVQSLGRVWHVTNEDIEAYLKALRLRNASRETVSMRLRYIRRALADLDWTLSPEGIRDYLAEVIEDEGPNVARHIAASLKSFLKNVLQPRDRGGYSAFYTIVLGLSGLSQAITVNCRPSTSLGKYSRKSRALRPRYTS